MALRSGCLGVLPPRLLQSHSPSGERTCTALVQKLRGSGESLVTRFDPGGQTAKTPLVAGRDWCVDKRAMISSKSLEVCRH